MKGLVVVPDTAGCGAERQAFLHISALRSEGHAVACVCTEGSWLAAQCKRTRVACDPRRSATGWLDSFAISRFARAQSADAVLGYGEEGARVGAKVAKSCGATAGAVLFDEADSRLLKGVDTVFASSRALYQSLSARCDAAVVHLPPAVPDLRDKFSERRASERARLKLEDHHIAVCVPGPLHPDLGQEVALDVLEQLGDPRLRLFILGSYQHDYGRELRLLAAQNAAGANSMIGQPADAGVYAGFDLCLAPFQAAHAAQHVLTAMSFGLPLVASPVGALQDMVVPGSNGYLATSASTQSLAEALLVTLDESVELAAMGRRSRRLFKERFGLRQMARALADGLAEPGTAANGAASGAAEA